MLTYRRGIYIWQGNYHTRHLPKQAGFRWDPHQKYWWTKYSVHAEKLREYADAAAEAALQKAQKIEKLSRGKAVDLKVPGPDNRTYLPFQKAGIQFLSETTHVLLGDEMGLGKTIQALGAINFLGLSRVLVVCPTSLCRNWANEAHRWLVGDWRVQILHTSTPLVSDKPHGELFIVGYPILHKLAKQLQKIEWDVIIADEAHYAKNPRAKRTQALLSLSAPRKWALTGTPIPNRPIEIFPVLQWLECPIASNWYYFVKRYCGAYRDAYGWNVSGATNLSELQRQLRQTVLIRRKKDEVLTELPEKRRQIVVIDSADDLVAEEQQIIEQFLGQAAEYEIQKLTGSEEEYAEAVRQLGVATRVFFEEIAKTRHRLALRKIPAALEIIENAAEDHKVVVWAHHVDVIETIAQELGSQAVVLHGGTPAEKRQEVIQRFQEDPKVRVFVGSITAGGVGITLTASSHVIFVELDWVPGNVTQAEDRCHRIGQRDSVLVQHLVIESSLDSRIAQIIVEKQQIIEQALDKDVQKPISVLDAVRKKITRTELDDLSGRIKDRDVPYIRSGIEILARSCDGAVKADNVGFSKFDAQIGKRLAREPRWTPRQASLAAVLCYRYRRQLPEDIVAVVTAIKDGNATKD